MIFFCKCIQVLAFQVSGALYHVDSGGESDVVGLGRITSLGRLSLKFL